jgi:hypothetical protein
LKGDPALPFARAPLRLAATAIACAVALSAARPAAAGACSALSNPVYVTGSGKIVIGYLAKALSASGIHLIYKLQGSCLAVDAILNGTKVGGAADLNASYWDATTEQTCTLDPAGNVADLGLSDVFPSTCQALPGGLPGNVGDFFGPVESYTFVVPKASSQKAISKAAAYFVYGFGADSGVAPWTDPTVIFQRDPNSGTQQMFAAAIGVPPAKWKGTGTTSSGDMTTKVIGSTSAEATIGILTAEVSGANRPTLNVLAYKDADQGCAYWPDATQASFDKRNVRDGHYSIWGPLHLLTKLNGMGYPIQPTAADVVGYLTGTKAAPNGLDLIALLAQASIIPDCAMQVRRTSELGPLMSYAPEHACGCYFEQVATGASKCKACMTDVECPMAAPRCSYGYCETQ